MRIGLLSFGSAPGGANPDPSSGFIEGLRELGYAPGRNLVIEARYADGQPEPARKRSPPSSRD